MFLYHLYQQCKYKKRIKSIDIVLISFIMVKNQISTLLDRVLINNGFQRWEGLYGREKRNDRKRRNLKTDQ